MNSNNTLYMKRPASWPGDLGREATLLGNGKTGVLVYGGVGKEKIQFNRSDLWNHAERTELPKLDGILKIRLPKGVIEPNLRISDAIYELSDRIIIV